MNTKPTESLFVRENLLHLLLLSSFSIAAIMFFQIIGTSSFEFTLADDVLAIASLLCLLCIYVIFFAICTKKVSLASVLLKVAGGLFVLGLTGMVGAELLLVFSIY